MNDGEWVIPVDIIDVYTTAPKQNTLFLAMCSNFVDLVVRAKKLRWIVQVVVLPLFEAEFLTKRQMATDRENPYYQDTDANKAHLVWIYQELFKKELLANLLVVRPGEELIDIFRDKILAKR